jgi:quercetin dioxygenase-like cupin family protein
MIVKTPLRPAPEVAAPAKPGEPIDVRPLGSSLVSAGTRTLFRSPTLELVRLVVRAGQQIPERKTRGEIIVHCLEGRVACTALGKTLTLDAGSLLDLPADEPHTLQGIEDASLLLSIIAPNPS